MKSIIYSVISVIALSTSLIASEIQDQDLSDRQPILRTNIPTTKENYNEKLFEEWVSQPGSYVDYGDGDPCWIPGEMIKVNIDPGSVHFSTIDKENLKHLKFPGIKIKNSSELVQNETFYVDLDSWRDHTIKNFSDTVEVVDMGEIKILPPGSRQKYLITFHVQPCVAVSLFNPENNFIGLAHLQGGPIGAEMGLSDILLNNSLETFMYKMGVQNFRDVKVNIFGGNGDPDMFIKTINFFENKGCSLTPNNIHPGYNTPFYSYDGTSQQDIDSRNGKLNIGINSDGDIFLYSYNSLGVTHSGSQLLDDIVSKSREKRCNQNQKVYLEVLQGHESENYEIKALNNLQRVPHGNYYYSIMPGLMFLNYMTEDITEKNIEDMKKFNLSITQYMQNKRYDDPFGIVGVKLSRLNKEITNFLNQ